MCGNSKSYGMDALTFRTAPDEWRALRRDAFQDAYIHRPAVPSKRRRDENASDSSPYGGLMRAARVLR